MNELWKNLNCVITSFSLAVYRRECNARASVFNDEVFKLYRAQASRKYNLAIVAFELYSSAHLKAPYIHNLYQLELHSSVMLQNYN